LLLLCSPVVLGWGPISHFYFSCLALEKNPRECILDPTNHPLLMGSATPDAFGFTAPSFQYDSVCPDETEGLQLHNLGFAGFMVNKLLTESNNTIDILVLNTLLGFGSHMVADLVGFHALGGYLSTSLDTKYGKINWLTMQPKMQVIDAYILHSLQLSVNNMPRVPISNSTSAFVAQSTLQYQQDGRPQFPVFNSTVISNCTTSWASMINRLYNYYFNAITAQTYTTQMVYFDQQNAQTFAQTETFFLRNAGCAGMAISHWWRLIQQKIPPDDAFAATVQFVNDLYQGNQCK